MLSFMWMYRYKLIIKKQQNLSSIFIFVFEKFQQDY